MNRRTFFATTIGALVAAVLPVKTIPKFLYYGDWTKLSPGDQVTYKCRDPISLHGKEKPELHTVTYVQEKSIMLECRNDSRYPINHWIARDGI